MHVDPLYLSDSLKAMNQLLAPRGNLAVSVRDPAPEDSAEIFYRLADAEVVAAASNTGLELLQSCRNEDRFGRSHVVWRSFVFSRCEAPLSSTERANTGSNGRHRPLRRGR